MAALRPVIARLRGRRRAGGADRCDTVRHSTASALIASGAHIKVVREMLGTPTGSPQTSTAMWQWTSSAKPPSGSGRLSGGEVVRIPVATPVATLSRFDRRSRERNPVLLGTLMSGWRDLNSRPLVPQIGLPWLSRVNHLSLGPWLTVEVR